MVKRAKRISRILPALLIALLGGTLAKANQPAPKLPARTAASCYCGCESKSKQSCTKMCELPKYAGRWWAVSCKKTVSQHPKTNPESRPQAVKRNRTEFARR